MKIQPVSFVVQTLFFSMKLLVFMSKAIKLLLTELVGQCRNILPLTFSTWTSLRSVNTEKDAGTDLPSVGHYVGPWTMYLPA